MVRAAWVLLAISGSFGFVQDRLIGFAQDDGFVDGSAGSRFVRE
jgi:hypothetical protein